MRYVTALSAGGHEDSRATHCARRYLGAFTKRRALLADCTRKLESLRMLSPVLAKTDRALVFTETVASAERRRGLSEKALFRHSLTRVGLTEINARGSWPTSGEGK